MAALQDVLDGERKPLRDRVRLLLRDPIFAYPDAPLPKKEHRDLVYRWLERLAEQGLGPLLDQFPDDLAPRDPQERLDLDQGPARLGGRRDRTATHARQRRQLDAQLGEALV